MNRIVIALLAGTAALGFVSTTYAADLIVEAPEVMPGIVDVSGNWDGAYVGVFGGYGVGLADHVSGPGTNDVDLEGFLLGVTAGVNFTLTEGIVAGVAGDLAWSNIGGEIVGGPFDGTEHTINWQGSVRGRLGFDGGAFMPYLTAGLAFANASRHTELLGGDDTDATHIGWTAGAGVEFAVTEDVSVDLQYRYTDLGEQDYVWPDIVAIDPTIDMHTHAVTVGLNWSF